MLTDAQYRALKAWPTPSTVLSSSPSDRFYEELVNGGLLYKVGEDGISTFYELNEPACTEAIREYEEVNDARD